MIDGGRVIAEGTSDELKTRVGGEVLALRVADRSRAPDAAGAVLGLGPGGGNVDNNTGEINVPVGTEGTAILTEAVRRLDDQGIQLADVGLRRPTLDDVFLALTGHAAEEADGEQPSEDGRQLQAPRSQARRRYERDHRDAPHARPPARPRSRTGGCITRRNLITYVRKPDLLVFSTIQPVMFVLLFVFVFGGAFELILPAERRPTSTS